MNSNAQKLDRLDASFGAAHFRALLAAGAAVLATILGGLLAFAATEQDDRTATVVIAATAGAFVVACLVVAARCRAGAVNAYNALRSAIAAEKGFEFEPTKGVGPDAASDAGIEVRYDNFASRNMLRWPGGTAAAVSYIEFRTETYYETVTETSATGETTTRQVARTRRVPIPVFEAVIVRLLGGEADIRHPVQIIASAHRTGTHLKKQSAAPCLRAEFDWYAEGAFELHEAMHPSACAAIADLAHEGALIAIMTASTGTRIVIKPSALALGSDRPNFLWRPSLGMLQSTIQQSLDAIRRVEAVGKHLKKEEITWSIV